jgi:hypothetical protein
MRALYERQANGEPFEVWRRNLGWSLDADERFNLQLRSYLDEFRELWHREGVRTDVSRYLDAAALFQGITGTTYEISPKFDAVHYNDAGSDLIARTVLAICRREASQPSATA